MKKSIGNLIDELSITNIRIWMAENIKRDTEVSPEDIVKATQITNKCNSYRNLLIEEIDLELNNMAKTGELQLVWGQGSNKIYDKK